MKNKAWIRRVLALIGAVFAVASLAVVPAFASITTDTVRTQRIQYKLTQVWNDPVMGGYSNDSYILYRAGSKVIWFDYDYQKGVNGASDKYKNVMCDKLLFDFDYERYGSEGAALVDTSCSVYADDQYLFTIVRRGTELETDDYNMLYVSYADGTRVYWEGSNSFDINFYVRHEWLAGVSVHGAQVSDSYYSPFSFFGNFQTTSPSQYEQGYNEGLSVGYSDGYEDGQGNGFIAGREQGYTEGEMAGYNSGYTEGYDQGNMNGYFSGYDVGYVDGEAEGYENGNAEGYTVGWKDGEAHGITETQGTLEGVKELVFGIFDAPTRLIDGMLDFNLFGIHLASTVKVILTLGVVSVIIAVIIKFSKG